MSFDLLKFYANERKGERARERRRGYPLHAYVGRNGSGKSMAAVYDTLPDLALGRPVLSTVRLLDWENPRPCDDDACEHYLHGKPGHMAVHPGYVPFTKWPQLLDFRGGAVLMDEITGVADSGESSALPSAVANKLAQLRRDECIVRITGLNFIRINKRLREAVNAVTRCESFFPVTVEGDSQIWRRRRLGVWRTYDAQSLPIDDHTDAAYEQADLLMKAYAWFPTLPAARAYDSFDQVHRVGTVSESGRCAHCGGTRRALECGCEDYHAEKSQRRSGGAQGRSPRTAPTPLDVSHGVARERLRA